MNAVGIIGVSVVIFLISRIFGFYLKFIIQGWFFHLVNFWKLIFIVYKAKKDIMRVEYISFSVNYLIEISSIKLIDLLECL